MVSLGPMTRVLAALLLVIGATSVLAEADYRAAHESAVRQAPVSSSSHARQKHHHHIIQQQQQQQQQHSSPDRPHVRDGETEEERAERWAKYVPRRILTDEVELSEARRLARERQVIKEAQRERVSSALTRNEAVASTKRQSRREKESEYIQDDEDDEDDAEHRATPPPSKKRNRKTIEPASSDYSNNEGHSRPAQVALSLFWIAWNIAAWFSQRVVWTPTMYAAHAVGWAAQTSWRTTRWTGERALVAPALTAGAPLIYLGQGALFLFVWLPARFIAIIVREVYPVYVFLGAGLAVGTAMGIVAALVLYIGSFVLGDGSRVEADLQRRAHEALPEALDEDRVEARRKRSRKSAAFKWGRSGESVIERAMRESREKEEKAQRRQSHLRQLNGQLRDVTSTGLGEEGQHYAEELNIKRESDEEDDEEDYFGGGGGGAGGAINQPYPPRSSTTASSSASPFGAPGWQGPAPRVLPHGATAQGGWSGSSSPASSPTLARVPLPHSSSLATGRSPLSSLGASPMTSPIAVRQRRI